MITTNAVVLCFEIVTRTLVTVPCPDGIEGCAVLHQKEVVTRKFVPISHGAELNRGVAFKPHILREIKDEADAVGCGEVIPIRAATQKGHVISTKAATFEDEVVGFLWRKKVEEMLDYLPKDGRDWE